MAEFNAATGTNLPEIFEQQQTPLHDGGVIPNLTQYKEIATGNSFASADQVFVETGSEADEGKSVDITGLTEYQGHSAAYERQGK